MSIDSLTKGESSSSLLLSQRIKIMYHSRYYNPKPYPQSSTVTLTAMKITGIVIITADLLLLLIWFGGAMYIIHNLSVSVCFFEVFFAQFFIVFHFVLGMCITGIVKDIMNQQKERQSLVSMGNERRVRGTTSPYSPGFEDEPLSYYFYSPLTWIYTSVISFFGDLALLCYSIKIYTMAEDDVCHAIKIGHIAFDSIALFISITSIIWWIVFSIYCITHKPQLSNSILL